MKSSTNDFYQKCKRANFRCSFPPGGDDFDGGADPDRVRRQLDSGDNAPGIGTQEGVHVALNMEPVSGAKPRGALRKGRNGFHEDFRLFLIREPSVSSFGEAIGIFRLPPTERVLNACFESVWLAVSRSVRGNS